MSNFFSKLPWWSYVLVGVIVLLVWQSVSGFSASSKLWNMVKKEIVEDQGRIIEIQAENMKWYEETISDLRARLEANQKKLQSIDSKLAEAERTIGDKDAEILALRRERESITTSSDPDVIVDDLHKLGYGSEHRRSK